jgi:hypothetical protein
MDRRASIVAIGCVSPDDDPGAYLAVREHVADLKALLHGREPDRLAGEADRKRRPRTTSGEALRVRL